MKAKAAWALVTVMVAAAVAAAMAAEAEKSAVSLRKVDAQVVLYRLYRGKYDGVGPAIGQLFGLAMPKGIAPTGPITFVYLNNPEFVAPEHYLTEIRIPVGEDALKLAGTLGEFTDVKRLPAMEMAVLKKEKGQTDAGALRAALAAWMRREGYESVDACWETFLSPSPAGGYGEMETEIAYPVRKVAQ